MLLLEFRYLDTQVLFGVPKPITPLGIRKMPRVVHRDIAHARKVCQRVDDPAFTVKNKGEGLQRIRKDEETILTMVCD